MEYNALRWRIKVGGRYDFEAIWEILAYLKKQEKRMGAFRVTTGILRAITQGTYEDPLSQIRELIANALDAEADYFCMISFSDSVAFLDNGSGLSKDQFEKDYLPLGYSPAYSNPNKIGRFGIGVMSVLPSCDRLYLFTKAAGQEPIRVEIDAKALFEPANMEKTIDTVFDNKYISAADAEGQTEWDRIARSIKNILGAPDHFTCVLLSHAKGEMLKVAAPEADEHIDYIGTMLSEIKSRLPLVFDIEDPFLKEVRRIDPRYGTLIPSIYNDPSIHRIAIDWYIEKDGVSYTGFDGHGHLLAEQKGTNEGT